MIKAPPIAGDGLPRLRHWHIKHRRDEQQDAKPAHARSDQELFVPFIERIVPAVIPAEEHERARRQRQHPDVENALHTEANIGPEGLTERFQNAKDIGASRNFRSASNGVAEILRQKPIRPMEVFARPRVFSEKFAKAAGSGRRRARLPPSSQHGALHQTIRPAEDRQGAEHALAKGHSPKQFDRREENSAHPGCRGDFLRKKRRLKLVRFGYGERAGRGRSEWRPRRWFFGEFSRVQGFCRVQRGSARGRAEQQPGRLRCLSALTAGFPGVHAMASSRTRCSANAAWKPMSRPIVAATWL